MRFVAFLAVTAFVLAGCAGGAHSSSKGAGANEPDALTVTKETGGIRGVVVDQAIKPVIGALITLTGGRNSTSDSLGQFNFTGLDPGEYLILVGKPGFKAAQTTTTVVAGVADPPVVKVLLEALSTAQPYQDIFKLDGFYECASAINFDTDTCDWVYRTGWDEANDTGHTLPTPRSFFHYVNTQFMDVAPDTFTIIQEGFWSSSTVKNFWVMVDSTPIDSGCDCSDTFGNVIGPSPTYLRMDHYAADGSENTQKPRADFINGGQVDHFPNGETVAARGFIPFQKTPVLGGNDPNSWVAVGQNFKFTITTVLFHNYVAQEGWNFEHQADYPIGGGK